MRDSTSSRSNLAPWSLHLVLAVLAGCHPGPTPLTAALADSVAGVVLVHGLDSPARLTVRAGEGMPPIAGSIERVEGAVRFTPRFPVEGVSALVVSVDTQRWTLPLATRTARTPSTRVVAIHPSAPVLPANQLRWYVEFSAPMREGSALAHVRLRDQRGAEMDKAFLEIDEELWDPTRTRLTLMFDMGRVKQGIQSRADLGPVLMPGEAYRLEIDRGWLDAHGAPLVEDTVHHFRVVADRHEPLDPTRWRMGSIVPGKRVPLRVDFGVPLDHALAERMIVVTTAEGERMGGVLRLVDHDRALEFTPTAVWGAGPYQLRVHPALEDVAGNRVGHAFDASIPAGQQAGVETRPMVITLVSRR